MERALAAAGIPRHRAEAPLEYMERALLTLDTSAEAVRRLTDLFALARFSQHEPDPSMRTGDRRARRRARRAAGHGAGSGVKLAGRLTVPVLTATAAL
jgi:hypothetical protein